MEKQKDEILKIPVSLEGFSFRKGTQDWGITFALAPENLKHGQPLQGCMNKAFILVPVMVDDMKEANEVMGTDDLENLDINIEGLNGK